jgi:hypothetical protein
MHRQLLGLLLLLMHAASPCLALLWQWLHCCLWLLLLLLLLHTH